MGKKTRTKKSLTSINQVGRADRFNHAYFNKKGPLQ